MPEGATFAGIEFAVGTSLRAVPTPALVDGGIELPDTTTRTFRLDGSRWQTPGPDDAEALVRHLVRALRTYVGRTVTQLRAGAGGAIALDLDQRLTS